MFRIPLPEVPAADFGDTLLGTKVLPEENQPLADAGEHLTLALAVELGRLGGVPDGSTVEGEVLGHYEREDEGQPGQELREVTVTVRVRTKVAAPAVVPAVPDGPTPDPLVAVATPTPETVS